MHRLTDDDLKALAVIMDKWKKVNDLTGNGVSMDYQNLRNKLYLMINEERIKA